MFLPPYIIDGIYRIEHQFLFQTPLLEIKLDDVDNQKLIENAYKVKEIDKGRISSNVGGWHSNYYTLEQDGIEYFNPLIEKFGDILPALPFDPPISELTDINLWFNISKKGDYNNSHNHPRCDLSGVYYVKVPEGDCGNIDFRDPRQSLSYGNSFIVERYHHGNMASRIPKVGNMYIFPSSLDHSVGRNNIDDDRISISFNLTVN